MKCKGNRIIAIIIYVTLVFNQKAYAINTILRAAYEPHLPPYQFLKGGKPLGIHIDILEGIAKNNNFIIDYIPMKSTMECFEALDKGKADIVLGASVYSNYKNSYRFTENISESHICIVASNEKLNNLRNSIGLKKFKASLENNTIRYSYTQNIRNLNYIVSPNQVRAFDLFISDKSDILIGVKHSILYQLEAANLTDKFTIISNYISPIEYTMAVRWENEELVHKLNDGLLKLKLEGKYEDIYNKWINEGKYEVRKILKRLSFLILGFLIILIINIKINRRLKKQVDSKTKELQLINRDLENQIIETKNSNELKNCIVENSPSGIIAFDRDYKITIFNKNAYKLANINECPIGTDIFKIELFNKILKDKKEDVFSRGIEFINKGFALKNEFNSCLHYRYSIYQLFNLDNNIRGAILDIKDITSEIIARDEIYEKEKNKALNQIIAGIAHEIRNPLMSIKTFAELIPVKKESAHFQDLFSEFVPKEVERANELIKGLIDYAKPDKGNDEIVSIKDIIDSCIVLVTPIIKDNRVLLNISIENGLTLFTNKNQLKQVLINIIFNSLQSVEEKIKSIIIDSGLSINIRAWADEDSIFIQIEDEGMGMTNQQIRSSMEPFYTTKSYGTGIGLWISRQYVEGNDGTIKIESEIKKYTKVTLMFRR